MDLAVRVERLAKSYLRPKRREGRFAGLRSFFSFERERIPAVREIDFTIRRGEAVGFIGENGAGKSTTIKMLTGLLLPTSGLIETLGMHPWRNRRQLATNIGVVFGQKPQLLWDIPAGHSFELLKAMYAIPEETYRFTFRETVERLELGELLKKPVRLLSLGQRMRCDLAASLLHAPAVAFLDEPTIGMDVLVKERVRELIVEMRRRFGMTVLLTTHDLKDISTTCERLLVLDQGRLLYDGDMAGFEKRFAGERIARVELSREPGAEALAALRSALLELDASLSVEAPRLLRIVCSRPGTAARVTGLVLQQLGVEDLSVQGTDIEALVANLYRAGSTHAV
ncbi:MAG TPA: ATP-binding cassette domain-containing protein [Polyangiaceae bacterium]|nr:ATP-binding cassette domain-containing protein [Polyangiaceae bacterium]